jgi:hypothetical protein
MTMTKSRPRTRYDDEDDRFEWKDGKKILRDGHAIRVSLRDSMQDDIARHATVQSSLRDSANRPAGSRPGFLLSRDATGRQQIADAYDAYEKDLTTAWQHETGIGSPERFVGQRAGDLCTINGAAGHLKMVDGQLVCAEDPKPKQDADFDARAAALAEHEHWLTNAWRGDR